MDYQTVMMNGVNSRNTLHQTHYNFWMCHAIVPQVKKASSEKISNF